LICRHFTGPVNCFSVASHSHVKEFHNLTVASEDPDTMVIPTTYQD